MSIIQGGINLGAPILPATEADIFPTHDAKYGKGGYRTVANKTERNAIPPARRSVGMVVRTQDDNIAWLLVENSESAELPDSAWVPEVDTFSMDGGVF